MCNFPSFGSYLFRFLFISAIYLGVEGDVNETAIDDTVKTLDTLNNRFDYNPT